MEIKNITDWLKENGYQWNIWKEDKIETSLTNNPETKLEINTSGNIGI